MRSHNAQQSIGAIAEGDWATVKATAGKVADLAESAQNDWATKLTAVLVAGKDCARADMKVHAGQLEAKADAAAAMVAAEHAAHHPAMVESSSKCDKLDSQAQSLHSQETALSKAASSLGLDSLR